MQNAVHPGHVEAASLPPSILHELTGLRARHRQLLKRAQSGDWSQAERLRSLNREIDHFLAIHARRSRQERGVSMVELLSTVQWMFPELDRLSQAEAATARHRRLAGRRSA